MRTEVLWVVYFALYSTLTLIWLFLHNQKKLYVKYRKFCDIILMTICMFGITLSL